MTKKFLYIGMGLFVTIIIVVAIVAHMDTDDRVRVFEKQYKVDLPNDVALATLYDDYGGVPYEGELLYRYSFSSQEGEQFISSIIEAGDWKRLPLSAPLSHLMYGDTAEVGGFAKETGMPKIINGYWRLVGDNVNVLESNDPQALDSLHSFNFSLAIYDEDSKILYMFSIDT
ncbi:hypothetical protein [Mahella australiensis]|uniref:Uncharacterized protein n=1 Tax=Mahella australiensis (strain DSM 15567 / CIP 107919 / 50-1 BON) TaxID=697281 RepID=F3ZXZ6_MAHA5|nr:hypothetical protein [Mahella australiensis]AEE96666.1 hypothetical protein Mahau_1475 [Mahella australiensis 50-1 BON]